MKDGFDKKRDMVKVLMDMLKKNSSDEVSKGLPQTKMPGAHPTAGQGMSPDMQKGMPLHEGHPHMQDLTQTDATQQKTSDSSMMSDGGMASDSDEPMRQIMPSPQDADGSADSTALDILPGTVEDQPAEMDTRQDAHNSDMVDDDQENDSSSFQAFLPRRKKK